VEEHEFLLLREVVAKQAPSLLGLVARVMPSLTDGQREDLRQAVAAELGETGFAPDGRITERGRSLEGLIDRLGHL
jgi:hypothetical protein